MKQPTTPSVPSSTNVDGGPGPLGRDTVNNVPMTVNRVDFIHADIVVFQVLLQTPQSLC